MTTIRVLTFLVTACSPEGYQYQNQVRKHQQAQDENKIHKISDINRNAIKRCIHPYLNLSYTHHSYRYNFIIYINPSFLLYLHLQNQSHTNNPHHNRPKHPPLYTPNPPSTITSIPLSPPIRTPRSIIPPNINHHSLGRSRPRSDNTLHGSNNRVTGKSHRLHDVYGCWRREDEGACRDGLCDWGAG